LPEDVIELFSAAARLAPMRDSKIALYVGGGHGGSLAGIRPPIKKTDAEGFSTRPHVTYPEMKHLFGGKETLCRGKETICRGKETSCRRKETFVWGNWQRWRAYYTSKNIA
jgi:hypothetical protein